MWLLNASFLLLQESELARETSQWEREEMEKVVSEMEGRFGYGLGY